MGSGTNVSGCLKYDTGAAIQTMAQRWVKLREVIAPRPEMVEVYERRLAAHRSLYAAVKEILI